ncbi:MAG: methionine--tRNA ligase, partial [Acetobacteraceae bacterium]|nr:methionine--tRNA ligase [Acetobacteraceae bacterium]
KRLDGFDVFFLTGTDEHGQKVEKAAREAGLEPRAFTDKVSANFRELTRVMGISNDDFIRTTEPRHYAACQELWRLLAARGALYLGDYAGWYAVRDEAFYAEDELSTGADGIRRAPSGAPVEWVREPSWFFRLSEWGPKLLEFYDAHPDFIGPASRRNEVVSFVRSGLTDLSVSRTSFRWGVPVPGDPAHVMYVWLDALTNYVTATGWPEGGARVDFWPADLHLVGKDIVRFHAVYWPAFLMAAGLAPPRRVFAHGWWTVEGQKMSKSLGNVIDPVTLVSTWGLDPVRYFLLREVPFGNDGDFSRAAIARRLNVELANDLGNLAQRTLAFVSRNAGGVVPAPGIRSEDDATLLASAAALLAELRAALDRQAFHEALEAIWVVVRAANAYIDRQAPWALRKTDPVRMGSVLWVLLETIRKLAILLSPFMPGSMATMLDQLGQGADARDVAALDRPLAAGLALPPPSPIFAKVAEAA